MAKKKPLRVLCLDGGGVLGYYMACVLEELAKLFHAEHEKHYPDIGKSFDLICGTSTGAILGCGLAIGADVDTLRERYKKHLKKIFPLPMPRSRLKLIFWTLRYAFMPSGSQKALYDSLTDLLKEQTFGTLYRERKIALCIPSVRAKSYQTHIFKTPHLPDLARDSDLMLRDACLASAAAPIYFSVASINTPKSRARKVLHVDGGLWANNPVIVGLNEALKIAEADQPIEIFSLGTIAFSDAAIGTDSHRRRGIVGWIEKADFFKMFLTAQAAGESQMAIELAASLRALGKEVEVFRLPQTPPSQKVLERLGYDAATDEAFQSMDLLAHKDALKIRELSQTDDPLGSAVRDLYEQMVPFNA